MFSFFLLTIYSSNTKYLLYLQRFIAECQRYTTNYFRWPEQLSEKFRLIAGEAYVHDIKVINV